MSHLLARAAQIAGRWAEKNAPSYVEQCEFKAIEALGRAFRNPSSNVAAYFKANFYDAAVERGAREAVKAEAKRAKRFEAFDEDEHFTQVQAPLKENDRPISHAEAEAAALHNGGSPSPEFEDLLAAVLDERHRSALVMRCAGKTFDEIAGTLDVSARTAKAYVTRGAAIAMRAAGRCDSEAAAALEIDEAAVRAHVRLGAPGLRRPRE